MSFDDNILPGMSLLVAMIFFVPLLVLVAVPVLFVTKRIATWRMVLTWLWLLWCLPAEGLMLMGYAFNSSRTDVLVTMAIWPFIGLAIIWLPLKLKELVYKHVPP